MPQFRPLTVGRLPRVFVRMLAMEASDRAVLCDTFNKLLPSFKNGPDVTCETMAGDIASILDQPKARRALFAAALNDELDDLLGQDFFGTEGQCDPRGDHRE